MLETNCRSRSVVLLSCNPTEGLRVVAITQLDGKITCFEFAGTIGAPHGSFRGRAWSALALTNSKQRYTPKFNPWREHYAIDFMMGDGQGQLVFLLRLLLCP